MSRPQPERPLFREVQRFRQMWLVALLLVVAAGTLLGTCSVTCVLWADGAAGAALPGVLGIAVGLGVPLLILLARLETEVTRRAIRVRLFPFMLAFREIPLSSLKTFFVRDYRPLLEYGGWGIRYGAKGMAYNVSGNRGVQLELRNGKKVLIGSQQPEELADAIVSALGS